MYDPNRYTVGDRRADELLGENRIKPVVTVSDSIANAKAEREAEYELYSAEESTDTEY